jgi:hypothetical protein
MCVSSTYSHWGASPVYSSCMGPYLSFYQPTLAIFPSPAGMSLGIIKFPARESLVSDIPAWGRENRKPFFQCLLVPLQYLLPAVNSLCLNVYRKNVSTMSDKYRLFF